MSNTEKNSENNELIKYLKANLLLQLRSLSDEKSREKPEFLLYRAGFSRSEIADILGRKYETVKKILQTMKTEKTEKVERTNSQEVNDEHEKDQQRYETK